MGCCSFPCRVAAAALGIAFGVYGQQQKQAGAPLSPAALVAAFDEQIQVRFLDPKLGFGMSRLCGPIGHGALGQVSQMLRRLPQPDDPRWENAQCGKRDWAPFRPRNAQETLGYLYRQRP